MIDSDRLGVGPRVPSRSGRQVPRSDGRPDPEALAVVQRTAAVVADRPVALAEAFYQHLFQLAPGVRTMFPADMSAQNEKLCRALFQCVRALAADDREATDMEHALRRLGAQHANRYAVQPEHYPYVGHALARAVRDLSQDWSTTCTSSWIWVYTWMSEHMLAGGNR
jgi:hemoglobin-like flavoprotein